MIQSHVVEIDGTFVGAAISTATGIRFRAVHLTVEELDDSVWPSLDELRRAVRHLFTTGRLGGRRTPVLADPAQRATDRSSRSRC